MMPTVKLEPKVQAVIKEGMSPFDLIILGGGPAGLSAGIYAKRAKIDTILIEKAIPGGLITSTDLIENYPGFPEAIGGPELMALFRKQAERFGARIVDVDVDRVDLATRPFRLWAAGVEYRAEAVIVA